MRTAHPTRNCGRGPCGDPCRGRGAAAEEPASKVDTWRWVYAPLNFQVNASVDELLALMKRAKADGYTGVLVTDSKFGHMADRPANYYANLERTRKAAADLGLELIPACCPVGYSNDALQNNPNLAEGIAVKAAPFIVRGQSAALADTANLLPGGKVEEAKAGKLAGWDFMDGPGVSIVQDTATKHDRDAASIKSHPARARLASSNAPPGRRLAVSASTADWPRT